MEKQSIKSTAKGGKRPGAGRPKGSVDKGNGLIRDMIVQALDRAGGVAYLERQAEEQPKAFLALIGRVMPVQIEGAGGGAIKFQRVERTIVDPAK